MQGVALLPSKSQSTITTPRDYTGHYKFAFFNPMPLLVVTWGD